MDAEKTPDKMEEDDENDILAFLDGLDVIDSWDDKSIDNTDAVKLDADSVTKTESSLTEKIDDDSYRNFQKSARLRVDRNNCKAFDNRHPRSLCSPGREKRGNKGIEKYIHKTHKDIRNDKVRKVKNHFTKLEMDDINEKPPGNELDNDIEYVLKKREEVKRKMRVYKSRSRSYSRERERRRRSPSREYRRKRFTPPNYNKYPNSNYGLHRNSPRGSATPNMPGVSHVVGNPPHDIPPLMPVYYPNVEYRPHYAPPAPQPIPFQPFQPPIYPTVHDIFPPPHISYDAPYIPPPVNEMLTYPPSYPLPPMSDVPVPTINQHYLLPPVGDVPVPTVNQHSVIEPNPQEALDSMLLEGKISMQDYSKLTTKSASGPVENSKYHELNLHNKADVLLHCHDAVLKLENLRLPNRLFVPPFVEAIAPSEVKYSSPLKRNSVQYSFTSAAKKNNTQNKLLISKIVHTLGFQKIDLNKQKKKVSIREISTQTISMDCYTCKIRQMTKNVSVEIQVDRADFTKSCHSQVIDQELASSKMVFGHGSNSANAPISLTHLTSGQIVSYLANKAKMLRSPSEMNEPEDNHYRRRLADDSSHYHQGYFGNKHPKYNPSGGSNAPHSYNQNQPHWGRKN